MHSQKKVISQSTQNIFRENEIVQLRLAEGIPGAISGNLAIVVNGQEAYPEYYQQMVDQIGEQTLNEEFIAIEWFNGIQLKNGYYASIRFKRMKPVAAA